MRLVLPVAVILICCLLALGIIASNINTYTPFSLAWLNYYDNVNLGFVIFANFVVGIVAGFLILASFFVRMGVNQYTLRKENKNLIKELQNLRNSFLQEIEIDGIRDDDDFLSFN